MKSCKHALGGGVLSTFFLRRWYPARVAGSHPRKSASIAAKVTAIEKRADQYQVVVQISPKHRGSFNTLAFGEVKPHSGSLQHGRLDLLYYQNPGLSSGDPFLPLDSSLMEAQRRKRGPAQLVCNNKALFTMGRAIAEVHIQMVIDASRFL